MDNLVHTDSQYKDKVSSEKEMDDTDKVFEVSTFSIFFCKEYF